MHPLLQDFSKVNKIAKLIFDNAHCHYFALSMKTCDWLVTNLLEASVRRGKV